MRFTRSFEFTEPPQKTFDRDSRPRPVLHCAASASPQRLQRCTAGPRGRGTAAPSPGPGPHLGGPSREASGGAALRAKRRSPQRGRRALPNASRCVPGRDGARAPLGQSAPRAQAGARARAPGALPGGSGARRRAPRPPPGPPRRPPGCPPPPRAAAPGPAGRGRAAHPSAARA